MIDICRSNSETPQTSDEDWLFDFQLENGPLVRFRHVTPADAELIADSIRTASAETLLHRFFSPIRSLPVETLRELLNIDRPASLCLVGQIMEEQQPRIICGARFVRQSADDPMAEFAITVHDEFQQRGLGTFLMRKLAEQAKLVGVVNFEGYVLYSNTGMRYLIRHMSPSATWSYTDEVIRVVIPVESLLAPPIQPLIDLAAAADAKHENDAESSRTAKSQSMKRMFVRLARLLSLKRHRSRPATSNEQPPETRTRRPSFRRRPR